MEENSSSQMGRFCRQWLLKIRICCHNSDYLTDSGIKKCLLQIQIQKVTHPPKNLSFAFDPCMEAVCMGLWAAFGARLKNIVPTFTWSWGGHLARAGVEPQLAVVKKGADLIIRTIRHHLLPPDCDASWETVGLGLIGSICSVPDVTHSVHFFSTLWQAFPFDLFLGNTG